MSWLDDVFELAEQLWEASMGRLPEEESAEESDEVRGLRKEYGHKLLAKDADIEALTAELNEVIQQRDNLQAQLRKVTRTVQRAWDAHNILREALYGVVR